MKILMILAPHNFRDEEYLHPRTEFEKNGASVMTTSSERTAHGMLGASVTNDFLIADVIPSEFDGIFFVGGGGSLGFLEDPIAKKIAGEFVSAQIPVGAICAAPRLLLYWGLLKNKKMTGWNDDGALPRLAKAGEATYVPAPIVIDGKFLTADGPKSAHDAGKKFFDLCSK